MAVAFLALSAAAAGAVAVFGPEKATASISFEEVAEQRGLDYRYEGHQVVNGNAGVYVGDYDADGWRDLLLIGNETSGPVLYHNSEGTFERSGELPTAVTERRIHSALFLDANGDGWEDVLLLPDPGTPSGGYTSAGGATFGSNTTNPLLLENENGSFPDVRVLENVSIRQWPIGATSADYDGDGCVDVFVYQNGDWGDRTPTGYRNPSSVGNITDDNGQPNLLLNGDCSGGFEQVGEAAGLQGERWSLVASFVDVTGDGLPDVHVANDFNEDVLYVNEGDGTFAFRKLGDDTDRNAMSSEVADFDGDGRPDVFVTQIGMASRADADADADSGEAYRRQAAAESPRYAKGNQLLMNRGNGTFVDRAPEYRLKKAPFVWGWAAIAADLDNDGDLDVTHANNEKSSVTSEGGRTMVQWTDTPPGVWENVGNHTHPEYASLRAPSVGLTDMNARGMARLDYDRDGDLDIVAADEAGTVKLFENQVTTGHYLQIELADDERSALGATVAVTAGDRTYYRYRNARVDFLSQETRLVHVGLGETESVESIRVSWPDGTTRRYDGVPVDTRITLYANGTVRER